MSNHEDSTNRPSTFVRDEGERISWCLGQAGCGAMVFSGFRGRARSCEREVRWAGLVLVEARHPVELWAEYACDPHAHHLRTPRELLERDQDRIEQRRRQAELARAGRPFDRAAPIDTGRTARARLRRALALASQEPNGTSRKGSA